MIGRSWLVKVAITNDCDLHWDETIMTSGEAYPTGARWTFISEFH